MQASTDISGLSLSLKCNNVASESHLFDVGEHAITNFCATHSPFARVGYASSRPTSVCSPRRVRFAKMERNSATVCSLLAYGSIYWLRWCFTVFSASGAGVNRVKLGMMIIYSNKPIFLFPRYVLVCINTTTYWIAV